MGYHKQRPHKGYDRSESILDKFFQLRIVSWHP